MCNVTFTSVRDKIDESKGGFLLYEKRRRFKSRNHVSGSATINRVKHKPPYLVAHNMTLHAGGIARDYLTRIELKTFTFSSGPQLMSIANAVLEAIPKFLLLTMIKNKEFLRSKEGTRSDSDNTISTIFHCTLTVDP